MSNNNKTTKQSTYKDLSCLRCRKKKAKCSKTRPTCLRCERSNHPCEYPDAPPNLTDLSKKVLDLYDSLRDLEGELLFKYLQPTSGDAEQDNDNELLDEYTTPVLEVESPVAGTTTLLLPQQDIQGSLSPIAFDTERASSPLPSRTPPPPPVQQEQAKEIDWSMSYLSDGISIQTTTHTISEFITFIDKLTRQLFQDFGNTDTSLSTYWELDDQCTDSTTGDDDDDELDEDAYLVTVPIFDISYFLRPTNPEQPKERTAQAPILDPSSILPRLIQYVHNTDTTTGNSAASARASGSPYRPITLLLDQLKPFLPDQDGVNADYLTDSLATLYTMTAYLTCHTFYNNDKVIPADPLDCYAYTKSLLIDIVFKVTPTYAICLSVLLLIWIQVKWQYTSVDGPFLLDLAWRMVSSALPHTKEAQLIGASLIYLDVYTNTFYTTSSTSPLSHDLGLVLRQQLSDSLRHLLKLDEEENRQWISMLLESQLMWFHHQVLGLFYTKTPPQNGDTPIKVRKVDVDEVLTLVRDLEQWEQHLPDWAAWQPTNPPQLHLTLNIIKILLFRPFSIEFNQQGMEQTYTKTTFLDLSMHSADRLATCLGRNGLDDCWTYAAHQMIWDVVNRVQTTFDFDPDIKLQLDAIVHRIDTPLVVLYE